MARLLIALALIRSFLADPEIPRMDPKTAISIVVDHQNLDRTMDIGVTIADRLRQICWRETRCRAWGVHDRDADLSRKSWVGQRRLRERQLELGLEPTHIDPECQPYKLGPWSTRGSWGLSAADQWPYLPPCYWPAWLDSTLVSAWVALTKYMAECEPVAWEDRPRWCTKLVRRSGPRAS